ncbi:fimbrial protein [Ignatzschineria cameli]|uniref:Fimbrial-type adhesion domain-containing protein n=1 Tax=Ignatzschineria cameli TaxID=2182793 RepID=A0A2U2ASR9_9GAMM|nr:fimbrial protein [Ignatzschineria cameli]PWD86005.1 hypothetical protein DC080_04405 [Ignatzschineria cameli]PWD87784.1 hypothetical protein DC077_00420 [Ignatzschineria cameli]
MKKLSLALVAALSLSTAAFAQTAGSDGQIKFTGTVTEKGCEIVAGNSANINLGSMPKASLKNAFSGWTTGEVKFINCNLEAKEGEGLQSVSITINPGAKASFGDDLWANNGKAKGVGIEVEIGGKDGIKPISPAGVTTPIIANIDKVNGTATYQVRGRMAGDAEVTAGSVETTVSFVASYK